MSYYIPYFCLFSELHESPDFADFTQQFPDVAESAVLFGRALETGCADLLRPVDKRGRLEVVHELGAVIARDVLVEDITKKVIKEHDDEGIGWMQSHNGSWFFSDFNSRHGRYTPTESRLQQVCLTAFGITPKFITNKYDYRYGSSGFQFPHKDGDFVLPSFAFGSGPGATRGQAINSDTTVPYSKEGAKIMKELFERSEATDIDTGSFDIAVFDGTKFNHHGIRNAPEPETQDPRFSFLIRF